MRVQYGNIFATCKECGCAHFEFLTSHPIRPESVLACHRCGVTTIHEHLVTQIGDKALQEAERVRALMQARHRQYQAVLEEVRRAAPSAGEASRSA